MAVASMGVDRQQVAALTQRFVRVPSISGDEGALAALVAEEMRAAGWDVHIDSMGNVLGRLGAESGKKLLYDAHLDTVDVGDLANWLARRLRGESSGACCSAEALAIPRARGCQDLRGRLSCAVASRGGELYLRRGARRAMRGAGDRACDWPGRLRPDWW